MIITTWFATAVVLFSFDHPIGGCVMAVATFGRAWYESKIQAWYKEQQK